MSKISNEYSKAVLDESKRVLDEIERKVTTHQIQKGLFIAIQYIHPLLDKNILKKGIYLVSSKKLGQIEIFVFHTKERDTIQYLFKNNWIKPCSPFSEVKSSRIIPLKNIYKSSDGFLTDYMKVGSPEDKSLNRPAEHMIIINLNWQKLNREKTPVVASWEFLDLYSDGEIRYKEKKVAKIDRTRKTYQGQYLFLKYLMNTHSEQKIIRYIPTGEIKQATKLYQNLTDLKDKLNKKLSKTEYVIAKSGPSFMLTKRG
jgi:hypothetical protein